jgi:hypothetical protein
MADAEDLKSSGDFSSCGFDSHPGHHFSRTEHRTYLVPRPRLFYGAILPSLQIVPNFVPTSYCKYPVYCIRLGMDVTLGDCNCAVTRDPRESENISARGVPEASERRVP